MIEIGSTLPEATLLRRGADGGPESIDLHTLTKGRKVVIFGLPGAFTRTCSAAHVPSFMRVKDQLAAKGVDDVICVAVNDPFVMGAWSDSTGAGDAGLHMLGDADGAFTKAMGLDFDAPPAGFHGRSKRYAMLVEDNTVKVLSIDANPGECNLSAGEAMLEALA
jgi:peroxiredoxin